MEDIREALRVAVEKGEWEPLYLWVKKIVRMTGGMRMNMEVDDVAQEVMMKMIKGGHFKKLYDSDASVGGIIRYIKSVTKSVNTDSGRKFKKDCEIKRMLEETLRTIAWDFEDEFNFSEWKEIILKIVDNWKNPTHRRIITSLVEGKSRKEIVREENVSEALISLLVKRIKEEVSALMEKEQ